jgi:peptidoglycan/xylan/chitin deacetylase (PgdA/CDA1 family)
MDAKISVCLSFDFDALSLWIGGFRARSLSAISRGEFGRVGAARILDLLRDFKIPATWFVPGHSAETFPQIVERIVADGHASLCSRGTRHQVFLATCGSMPYVSG